MELKTPLFTLDVTYTYRNGTSFTEHYPKPQDARGIVYRIEQCEAKAKKESNIVQVGWKTHKVAQA